MLHGTWECVITDADGKPVNHELLEAPTLFELNSHVEAWVSKFDYEAWPGFILTITFTP